MGNIGSVYLTGIYKETEVHHEIEPNTRFVTAFMGGVCFLVVCKPVTVQGDHFLMRCAECYPMEILSVGNYCIKVLLKPSVMPQCKFLGS